MTEKKLEANYVICDLCGKRVPQSCIIFEKGGSFPALVKNEHRKHGVEICSDCFYEYGRMKKAKAA